MASIEDVAREAGVSISTVSYALSGKRSIRESTRERVRDAADRLGYLPHASARMLASNRSNIIAVVAPLHPDTDDRAHMEFALEVTRAARRRNYDTLLFVDDDALAGMKRNAATSLADGIIVLDVDADDARADFARSLSYPTVFIGIPAETRELVCVDLDFESAAALAVERLAAAGCTSIGLITHCDDVISRGQNFPLRVMSSFEQDLTARGIAHAVATPRVGHVEEALDELIAALPRLDGLVVNSNPEVAWAVTSSLARRGLNIPEDVSVIAVGVPYSTERLPSPLDTIPLVAQESCELAVSLLTRIIDEGFGAPETTLIPPTYIERGSVRTSDHNKKTEGETGR